MSEQREYLLSLLGDSYQGGKPFAEHQHEMAKELDAYAAEVRAETLREAAEVIRTSKHLRSWTDDHMGDIEEAAWVLQEKAEEEK